MLAGSAKDGQHVGLEAREGLLYSGGQNALGRPDDELVTVRSERGTGGLQFGDDLGGRRERRRVRRGPRPGLVRLREPRSRRRRSAGPTGRGLCRRLQGRLGAEVVKVLLQHKADVNAVTSGRATPLIFAARSGDSDVVHMLLEAGADPNVRDADGKTALDYAVLMRRNAAAEELRHHPSADR